ncbi:MAG: DUF3134 domain-containing protein [Chroococcidiopsidaceae cyanobacterium CP_BM_ER_R8_30]|nr:DUF3134 domain-containing protein [Chroococcidiopsidaceae cyanobacterium CP_BM_ER_R8_30]
MNRNPLIEYSRYEPAPIIPVHQESSMITWLESTGRLVARTSLDTNYPLIDGDDPEISGLIDTEEIADDFELGEEEELDAEEP